MSSEPQNDCFISKTAKGVKDFVINPWPIKKSSGSYTYNFIVLLDMAKSISLG